MSPNPHQDANRRQRAKEAAITRAYRRIFASDEGRTVLVDLTERYHPTRRRFTNAILRTPHPHLAAAVADGESGVMRYIIQRLSSEPGDDEEAVQTPLDRPIHKPE